jgi:hypothetical protein
MGAGSLSVAVAAAVAGDEAGGSQHSGVEIDPIFCYGVEVFHSPMTDHLVTPNESLLHPRLRRHGGRHPDRASGEIDPQRDRDVNLIGVRDPDVAPVRGADGDALPEGLDGRYG